MKEVTQLNGVVPADLAKRVRLDAVEMNSTLNDYMAASLAKFLALPIAQRRVIMADKKNRKITGRPINPE